MKVFAFNPILEELFDTPPTSPQSSRVTNLLEIEGNPEKTGSPLMSSSVCKKRGKAATACVQVSCCRHCLSAGGTGSSLRVIRLSSFSTQEQKHSEHYIL